MRDYISRYASLVVADSHATADRICGWVPDGMLRTIPNGIDLERFAAVTPRVGTADRALIVGMVANLTSWKKHDLFLDVAQRVSSKTSTEFHVYGQFPSNSKLRSLEDQIERRGLKNRVRLQGFVADPARIMAEVDVVVHPADHESFGRVLVEAMAAGVPVVGVRGGGAAEIVIDGITGLLASPNDAAGLAECHDHLLADASLRTKLGEAGRRRAAECYSLERCVQSMAEVYRLALTRPIGISFAGER
jgi:glycosyltransferase involved in cell wall biosynthesis